MRKTFWEKVDVRGKDECWNWKLAKQHGGYGQSSVNGINITAHRLACRLSGRNIEGMCVCHKCDNRACCNPSHLFLGTRVDNVRDMDRKGRRSVGSNHWKSKITEKDVLKIRSLSGKMSVLNLSKKFNLSDSSITKIIKRQLWKQVK